MHTAAAVFFHQNDAMTTVSMHLIHHHLFQENTYQDTTITQVKKDPSPAHAGMRIDLYIAIYALLLLLFARIHLL